MKLSRLLMIICLTVFSIIMFSTQAYSKGWEHSDGTPPYGVAMQSDAQGIKLNGALFIEFYNFRYDGPKLIADARSVLRLRKGTSLGTFYTTITGLDFNNPVAVQSALTTSFKTDILQRFFNGDLSLGIIMKTLDEYGEVSAGTSHFVLADIVVTVK